MQETLLKVRYFELKVWKGKKLQKFEYIENEKSFLDEIKNIFHSFSRTII